MTSFICIDCHAAKPLEGSELQWRYSHQREVRMCAECAAKDMYRDKVAAEFLTSSDHERSYPESNLFEGIPEA